MKDFLVCVLFIVIMFLGIVLGITWAHLEYDGVALVEKCQLELPRDQYCHLIAIPNEIQEEK